MQSKDSPGLYLWTRPGPGLCSPLAAANCADCARPADVRSRCRPPPLSLGLSLTHPSAASARLPPSSPFIVRESGLLAGQSPAPIIRSSISLFIYGGLDGHGDDDDDGGSDGGGGGRGRCTCTCDSLPMAANDTGLFSGTFCKLDEVFYVPAGI
jgi:hypothetical protein